MPTPTPANTTPPSAEWPARASSPSTQVLTPTITHALSTPATRRSASQGASALTAATPAVTAAVANRPPSTSRRGRPASAAALSAPSR